jgi:DNA invertase Pin-like site-specific DNA recombinase
MMTAKITDRHLSRMACVYIRQSTVAQVRFNQESTERQYNLASKAQSLGWGRERIRILDRDLGQSGARTTHREDFKSLVSDVAMGNVGAIFSLEASRLARSNQDWHRLLELCAITNTLVIDEDGCYDPTEFNDGLVLGMKGTFAQAELHHRTRLLEAQQGAQGRAALPVAGQPSATKKIVLDPDPRSAGRRSDRVRAVREGGHGIRGRATLQARSALSAPLLWRPGTQIGGGRLTHSRVLGLWPTVYAAPASLVATSRASILRRRRDRTILA